MDDLSPESPDRESGELSTDLEDFGSDTEDFSKKDPPSRKRKAASDAGYGPGEIIPHPSESSPPPDRPVSGGELNTVRASRWEEESLFLEETQPQGIEGSKLEVLAPSDQNQRSNGDGTGAIDAQSDREPEDGDYADNWSESVEIGKRNGAKDEQDVELSCREVSDKCDSDGEHEVDSNSAEMSLPDFKVDMLKGCRSVEEFERVNRINEGTYGVVYKAVDKKTGEIVALKKVKMEKEREGFPMTSLREINILLSIRHPCIVNVKEVVVGSSLDSIFMVMEYMEHDLKRLMESMNRPFSQSEVKYLMFKLIEGIKYLHDNWVLHRDLKTSNILINNLGELKICDFGLARQYGSPLKTYTSLVVTLWYRAPELLLGCKEYSTAIDTWSLGCIMAELLAKKPLFSGKNEMDQLDKIFRTLGTPDETIWPDFPTLRGVKCNFVKQPFSRLREKFPPTAFAGGVTLSNKGFDLLSRLLTYDPKKRISTEDALNHEWFKEFPLPKGPQLPSLKKGRQSPS